MTMEFWLRLWETIYVGYLRADHNLVFIRRAVCLNTYRDIEWYRVALDVS